jgi:Tfp pilus assembly protein FimT
MSKYTRGITLLEVVIGISIMVLIFVMVVPQLSRFRSEQALKNTTEDIVSMLNYARSQTLSSRNSTYYSVHLDTDRIVLFTGGTYSANDANNKIVIFDKSIYLPPQNIVLNGNVTEIKFDRLTGDTSQYGTIRPELISDNTRFKLITVNKTGIISAN